MAFTLIKCNKCGKYVDYKKKRPDGNPPIIGFIQDNGKGINVCADCIMELGRLPEDQRDEFFRDMGVDGGEIK